MNGDSEQITAVTIYNQTYHVRSGGEDKYVHELAAYVDHKMVELSEKTPTVDTLKVAILAALNIADDYVVTKEKLKALEQSVAETAERMAAALQPFLETESS